jgi:CheY-like chemotaxis protein
MAHNILEILNKCERRLSKKAKRLDRELQISGQALFVDSETRQGDEWQRLFIAIIQLHIDSLAHSCSQLKFQRASSEKQAFLIIENVTEALRQSENYDKLNQTCQQIEGTSLKVAANTLELTFELGGLSNQEQSEHKHILCADDNPDNRQIIKLLLEKMGHKVSTAENGKLALEATLEQEFDLIFLDIQMPVMDGIEALELIRSTACETPVIAFTAQVFDHEVSHLLNLGFNAWLAKPIDRSKLDDILLEYLDSRTNTQTIEIDPDELANMKQSYQQSLTLYIQDLEGACLNQDLTHIARIAHALKGSGGNFGFDDITQIAGLLEPACTTQTESLPTEFITDLVNLLNTYKI